MIRSVHRIAVATVTLPGRYNPPCYEDTRIPVYAYLIQGDGTVVLVDTGVGEGNERIDARFQPARASIVGELSRLGVEPPDVDAVVNSHLHFDHCGNNRLFPHARVFVQARELETARRLGERYTVPDWFDHPDARFHAVNGDAELCPGIRLLSTPGHTPGHQSVLVESGGDLILVAAQAAFTADEFERGGDPDAQAHEGLEDRYLQSIVRLTAVAADRVCFSHDAREEVLPTAGP